MSEKFEDLMYKAGLTASGCWDAMDSYDQAAIERFGMLVMQECIKRCDVNYEFKNHIDTEFGRGIAIGIEVAKEQIKIHFGVD